MLLPVDAETTPPVRWPRLPHRRRRERAECRPADSGSWRRRGNAAWCRRRGGPTGSATWGRPEEVEVRDLGLLDCACGFGLPGQNGHEAGGVRDVKGLVSASGEDPRRRGERSCRVWARTTVRFIVVVVFPSSGRADVTARAGGAGEKKRGSKCAIRLGQGGPRQRVGKQLDRCLRQWGTGRRSAEPSPPGVPLGDRSD